MHSGNKGPLPQGVNGSTSNEQKLHDGGLVGGRNVFMRYRDWRQWLLYKGGGRGAPCRAGETQKHTMREWGVHQGKGG